jgi:hypothetical protein
MSSSPPQVFSTRKKTLFKTGSLALLTLHELLTFVILPAPFSDLRPFSVRHRAGGRSVSQWSDILIFCFAPGNLYVAVIGKDQHDAVRIVDIVIDRNVASPWSAVGLYI